MTYIVLKAPSNTFFAFGLDLGLGLKHLASFNISVIMPNRPTVS